MFDKKILQNKVVVVTGGARGIGRAISELLAALGARVIFFYHKSSEQALSFQEEAQRQGLDVIAMQVDVRISALCEAAIETVFQKSERIDILVNNSGVIRDNLLPSLGDEDIKEVLDTNVLGVFNMTRAVIPYMLQRRSGKIINISSVASEKGGRGQANYAASKGAVNAFTKALAVELAPRSITVNGVAPGIIETDMSKEIRELGADKALSKILLKRFGKPEEVAYAVAFLASPYADYLTGEIIHVDGGFKME